MARTTSSVRSVGTPAACFGQEIQRLPSGGRASFQGRNRLSRSARVRTNAWIMSTRPSNRLRILTRSGILPRSRAESVGDRITTTAKPGLIPSFSASGLDDEPAGIGGGLASPPPPHVFSRARGGSRGGGLFPPLPAPGGPFLSKMLLRPSRAARPFFRLPRLFF